MKPPAGLSFPSSYASQKTAANITANSLAVYYPTYDTDEFLSHVGAVHLQDGSATAESWLRSLLTYREEHNVNGKRAREEGEEDEDGVKGKSKIHRPTAPVDDSLPPGFISLAHLDAPSPSGSGTAVSATTAAPVVGLPIGHPDGKKWMSVMNEGLHKNRLRAEWAFSCTGQAHELIWTATLNSETLPEDSDPHVLTSFCSPQSGHPYYGYQVHQTCGQGGGCHDGV